MKPSHLLLAAALAVPALATSSSAFAQDGYEDLDNPDGEKVSKPAKQRKNRQNLDGPVKEITRGTFAKSSVGGALYLGNFAGFVSAGTSVGLSVGHEFYDQEGLSMGVEAMFFQGIHNGCYYELQAAAECPNAPGQPGPLIQGDLRTYTLAAVYEISIYPARRFGMGLRAGGGVLFSPLLMNEQYFNEEVVADAWGGQNPGYHGAPHPVVMGGPTFEYYTKLSHFSVGLDTDVFYAVNFDLGTSVTGYLKYTF
jgi:hypothetical protein